MEVTRHRTAVTTATRSSAATVVPGWGVGEIEVEDGCSSPTGSRRQRRPSPAEGAPKGERAPLRSRYRATRHTRVTTSCRNPCRRFVAHLAGTPVDYDDVPVAVEGLSPFQRELLDAARSGADKRGRDVRRLGKLAGRPRAARAAGSFCAVNCPLVVPAATIAAPGG